MNTINKHECCLCGKHIDHTLYLWEEYAYKLEVRKNNKYETHIFCSWHCLRDFEKKLEGTKWKI